MGQFQLPNLPARRKISTIIRNSCSRIPTRLSISVTSSSYPGVWVGVIPGVPDVVAVGDMLGVTEGDTVSVVVGAGVSVGVIGPSGAV